MFAGRPVGQARGAGLPWSGLLIQPRSIEGIAVYATRQEEKMNPEVKVYLDAMDGLRRNLRGMLASMDSEELNWKPLPGDANSLYAIIAHMCAGEFNNVGKRISGQAVEPGYADTFHEEGDDPNELVQRLDHLEQVTHSVLEGLTSEDMDRALPSAGSGPSRTVREILSAQLRHQNLHLGHIEITKQLYEAGKRG